MTWKALKRGPCAGFLHDQTVCFNLTLCLPPQVFTTEGFLHLTMPEQLTGSEAVSPEPSRGKRGGSGTGSRGSEAFATAFKDPGQHRVGMPPKVGGGGERGGCWCYSVTGNRIAELSRYT